MKLAVSALALALAAVGTTACDRPKTESTAYNNSGTSATTGSTTTPAAPTSATTTTDSARAANTTAAPGPAGDATGAMSETVTTAKIKAAIASDAGMKDADVSVTTNNGVVMLGGTVKSQDQVALATGIAQRQDGVSKVESSITVK